MLGKDLTPFNQVVQDESVNRILTELEMEEPETITIDLVRSHI